MNQRTQEDMAVPSPSSLSTPDRVGATPAAATDQPVPTDRVGTNVVATANVQANCVSGVIVAITSSSITVHRRGSLSTYAITPETTFTEGLEAITASDLTVGEHVGIQVAPSSPPSTTSINIQPAVPAGRVTAVYDNKITIHDEEGLSRTIVVNALTASAKSDVATSLSELSVGSSISARGWVDATPSHLS